jgi:hypothetical protein
VEHVGHRARSYAEIRRKAAARKNGKTINNCEPSVMPVSVQGKSAPVVPQGGKKFVAGGYDLLVTKKDAAVQDGMVMHHRDPNWDFA